MISVHPILDVFIPTSRSLKNHILIIPDRHYLETVQTYIY